MLHLTQLNGEHLVVNPDHVLTVAATPDTQIRLSNGERYVVRNSVAEIETQFLAYKRQILQGAFRQDSFSEMAPPV